MAQITELASGAITAVHHITIELVESDETPPVIIIRWPSKPSVLHPRRFPSAANITVALFAGAVVRLAHIRRDHRRL
jgi:hypothetical protein